MSLNKSFYFQYAMYLATLLKFIANLFITTNTLSKATISSFETKCTPPAAWAIENMKKRTSIIVIKITFPRWTKAKDLAELQRNWSDRWIERVEQFITVSQREMMFERRVLTQFFPLVEGVRLWCVCRGWISGAWNTRNEKPQQRGWERINVKAARREEVLRRASCVKRIDSFKQINPRRGWKRDASGQARVPRWCFVQPTQRNGEDKGWPRKRKRRNDRL